MRSQLIEILALAAIGVLVAVGHNVLSAKRRWWWSVDPTTAAAATPYGAAAQILTEELKSTPMVICIGAQGGSKLATELQHRNSRLHAIVVDEASRIGKKMSVDENRRLTLLPQNIFDHIPEGADTYLIAEVLHRCDENQAFELIAAITRSAEAGHLKRDAVLFVVENLHTASEPVTGDGVRHRSSAREARRIPRVEGAYRRLLEKHGWRVKGKAREASPGLHIIAATRPAGGATRAEREAG